MYKRQKPDNSSQGQGGVLQVPEHSHAAGPRGSPHMHTTSMHTTSMPKQTNTGGTPGTTTIEEMCGMSGGSNGGFEPVPANW